MPDLSPIDPPTLRITRRAADRIRAGHLWVYRSDLAEDPAATLAPGALVTLLDARSAPLGAALYSTTSQIAARLVSTTPGIAREEYLIDLHDRLAAALERRRIVAPLDEHTNAQRLIFSEADDLPGIVLDRYNDLLILQLLHQGTAQRDVRDTLTEFLLDHFGDAHSGDTPLTLWERPDPRIRELEQLPAPPDDGLLFTNHLSEPTHTLSSRPESSQSDDAAERPLYSPPPISPAAAQAPATTTFRLNTLNFHYDASAGQKTGAFLDQRLNYAAAARHVAASGRTARALDICTYHGGFALHLAQVCERVTGVDQSRAALETADWNLSLNPQLGNRVDWIEADAFELLRAFDDAHNRPASAPPTLPLDVATGFDAIVLDPPAFAKSKRAVKGALRGYKELNLRALRLLTPGGTLVTCSCSHHVSPEEFFATVSAAAADAHRRVQLLEFRAAAPDHPEVLTLPETRYLKCLILRVE